jgi:hypothetical protein
VDDEPDFAGVALAGDPFDPFDDPFEVSADLLEDEPSDELLVESLVELPAVDPTSDSGATLR